MTLAVDRTYQMPISSNQNPSRDSQASNFLFVVFEGLFDVIAHPIRTTINILKMPFRFGQQIANSETLLGDSVRYNVEGVAILILVSNLVGGGFAVHLLPDFRHSEELEGILYAFGAIATGLCGYLAIRVLRSRAAALNGTVAAYNYWFGLLWLFCLVTVPLEICKIDPQSRLGSMISAPMVIAALLLFFFLIRWIADINQVGPIRAFASFWLGLIFFNIMFRPLFFLLNHFLKRWHVAINPYTAG
jgi:hypothetical protein